MQAELSFAPAGGALVCGVDEAGRGPLAGPVVSAAVMLPAEHAPTGLADSKALSRGRRETLYAEIMTSCGVGVGQATVAEIDELNILRATLLSMARAVAALPTAPTLALVDGNRPPALACEVRCIVKGDATEPAISAASIVAKVTRDRIMHDLALRHPGYGWERNAAYGTAEHRAALRALGATEHHRTSFAPVREVSGHAISR